MTDRTAPAAGTGATIHTALDALMDELLWENSLIHDLDRPNKVGTLRAEIHRAVRAEQSRVVAERIARLTDEQALSLANTIGPVALERPEWRWGGFVRAALRRALTENEK